MFQSSTSLGSGLQTSWSKSPPQPSDLLIPPHLRQPTKPECELQPPDSLKECSTRIVTRRTSPVFTGSRSSFMIHTVAPALEGLHLFATSRTSLDVGAVQNSCYRPSQGPITEEEEGPQRSLTMVLCGVRERQVYPVILNHTHVRLRKVWDLGQRYPRGTKGWEKNRVKAALGHRVPYFQAKEKQQSSFELPASDCAHRHLHGHMMSGLSRFTLACHSQCSHSCCEDEHWRPRSAKAT